MHHYPGYNNNCNVYREDVHRNKNITVKKHGCKPHDYEVNLVVKKDDPNKRSCFDMFKKTACALIQSVPIHCQCVPVPANNAVYDPCDSEYETTDNNFKTHSVRHDGQDMCLNQGYGGGGGSGKDGSGGGSASKQKAKERSKRRKEEKRMGKTRFKECKRKSKMIHKKYKQKEKARQKAEKAYFTDCLNGEKNKLKQAKQRFKDMKKCAKETRKANKKREKQKLKRLKEKLKNRCKDLKNTIVSRPGSDTEDDDIPFEDPMSMPDSAFEDKKKQSDCSNHPCFFDAINSYVKG